MDHASQVVFLALPHTGFVSGEALPGLIWATQRGRLIVSPGKISLLATNFNQLWCEALNQGSREGITHWAMHHSDIQAPCWWIDTLVDELERVGADILSVVVPLKDERGLTTTAVGSGGNSIRRLTLREAHQLPETFSIADIPGDEPQRRLLVNTGLWVCRFTEAWVEPPGFPGFQLQDQIRKNAATGKFEAVCLSEDWGFSEWAHSRGLKVFATRKVPVTHYGTSGYSSARPTGRWTTDLGDARKDERPDEAPEPTQEPTREPMSAKLYEQLGRKQERIDELDAAYSLLLNLLAGVVDGSVCRSRVLVNKTDRSWVMVPEGERPAMPATINGLPVVAVAPEAPKIDAERFKELMLERADACKANGNGTED